jgi:hypothetical protein
MVVGKIILRQRWWRLIMRDVVVCRRRRRVGVDGMLHLFEWRLLSLFLLVKDINVAL